MDPSGFAVSRCVTWGGACGKGKGLFFLGLAIGAVVLGVVLAIGRLPLTDGWALVLFAVLSFVAYASLRATSKRGHDQKMAIRGDINGN